MSYLVAGIFLEEIAFILWVQFSISPEKVECSLLRNEKIQNRAASTCVYLLRTCRWYYVRRTRHQSHLEFWMLRNYIMELRCVLKVVKHNGSLWSKRITKADSCCNKACLGAKPWYNWCPVGIRVQEGWHNPQPEESTFETKVESRTRNQGKENGQ